MATTISKEEFETLPGSLQNRFKADGDNYVLEEPDVDGLKNKNAELLGKLKGFKDFDGLDAAEVKAKLKQLEEQEQADALAKGKWEELEKKLRESSAKEIAVREEKLAAIIAENADKDLLFHVLQHGAKEKTARGLMLELKAEGHRHEERDGKAVWLTPDGEVIDDLGTYIPGLKESKADYFKSDLGSGSGSSGSNGSGGGQKQDLSSLPATARLTQLFEQNK